MTRLYAKKPMGERLLKYTVDSATGCWNWTGSKDRDGYGRMISSDNGVRRFTFAHRESYTHHVGAIGVAGSSTGQVLHKCDNPSCISPAHLYLGDPAANGQDKKERGRARGPSLTGDKNGMYGRTGALNPMYGKKHTPETIEKIKKAKRYV